MRVSPRPSLGWDLAGYGDSGSALCRADRNDDVITATILRAPFICRPRHTIVADIQATANAECEMLRRFARIGNIYLDVPVDLEQLIQFVDHLQDERALYYWQLVKRPMHYVFRALEPLASNLGFAVARTADILGWLAAEHADVKLGVNLFETYPAATLQLVSDTNQWTEAKYKGGQITFRDGRWHAQESKRKNAAARIKEERKNDGLASLANALRLQTTEGSDLDDDEFDAILCAITGCIPECAVHGDSLVAIIRKGLVKEYGDANWISLVQHPEGYVVFDRLPAAIQIHLLWTHCPTLSTLFDALG